MAQKKPQSRSITDREQLAQAIFLGRLADSSKTVDHAISTSFDTADAFFDELESRRKPVQKPPTAEEINDG